MLAINSRIEQLEEENRQLRAKIADLSGLGLYERAREVFDITHRQATFLVLLLNRRTVSHSQATEAVYDDDKLDDLDDPYSAIRTIVKHLRRAIAPHGVRFRTVYGHGWEIDDWARQRALDTMRAA